MSQLYVPHYHLSVSGAGAIKVKPGGLEEHCNSKCVPWSPSRDGRLALIDRDGVMIEKSPAHTYIERPEDVNVLEGVPEAVKELNDRKIPVAIVTNQPGVAKKLYTKADIVDMTAVLLEALYDHGASIQAVFFCPHPKLRDARSEFEVCTCRKPKTGMLDLGFQMFGRFRERTFYFGDFVSDVEAATRAGMVPVYVATKHDEFDAVQARMREEHPGTFKHRQYPTLRAAVGIVDIVTPTQ